MNNSNNLNNLEDKIIITSIKKEKSNRYRLFYGEDETAVVIDEIIVKNNIRTGTELSYSKLENIIEESNLFMAKEKAFNLLSFRDHSKKELINKMKNQYDKDSVEKAVDKIEELGFIDDKNFANKYALDLVNIKKFSYNRVRIELSRKGIERDIIDEVLDNVFIDEESQIKELLDGKFKRKLQNEKGEKQVINSLIRMGYSLDKVINIIRYRKEDY